MINKFRFFEGIIENEFVFDNLGPVNIQEGIRTLRATWSREMPDELESTGVDVVSELTRLMSDEIARGIDEDILRTITTRINGGGNHGVDYLNHWLNIGNNRA